MHNQLHLDSLYRFTEIQAVISKKPSLHLLYEEVYAKYSQCLKRIPEGGLVVELGSGCGFAKDRIAGLVTTDVLAYPGVDKVVDALAMPFEDGSVRALFLHNTFHHIPDVGKFLKEAERCLKPGGRIFMVDQHVGWVTGIVLRYLHHEGYEPKATRWEFESSGPLSGANGALAWIVFQRDIAKFERGFPALKLERYEPHTPLRYWASGGLKWWTLIPRWAFSFATWLDSALTKLSANFGSFVDVEIVKQNLSYMIPGLDFANPNRSLIS